MKFIISLIDASLRLLLKVLIFLKLKSFVAFLLRTLTRAILFILHKLYFRLEIIGHNNIPKTGGIILAANHQSYLDPPLF